MDDEYRYKVVVFRLKHVIQVILNRSCAARGGQTRIAIRSDVRHPWQYRGF